MADLPTPAELVAKGRGVYRTLMDPAGTGVVNLRAGSRNDAQLSVFLGLVSRVLRYAADRFSASRLSSALDDDLDIIAQDLFGTRRKDAAAAIGTIYLQRTGALLATAITQGSRFAVPPQNGQPAVVFQASASVSVGATVTKVAVPLVAVATGVASNVALSSITSVLDPLGDPAWSIYQPLPGDPVLGGGSIDTIGGGADLESNDILRDRLRQLSISDPREHGTLRAVQFGVLQVPGIRFATVLEPAGAGMIVIFAGDATYALPHALAQTILLAAAGFRACGVPALALPYNVQTITVTATIYMARALSNYNLAAVRAKAIANVKTYFTVRTQSDEYLLSGIDSALFSADPDVQDVAIAAPLADQRRLPDSAYASATQINRYVVSDASIQISIAPPRTS